MTEHIIKFIKESKKEKIAKELLHVLYNIDHCPEILGEGFNGVVYLSKLDQKMPHKIGNKTIQMPIVIKTNNESNKDSSLYLDILDNTLFINGSGGINTEVLILSFLKELFKKTIHLPLILSYATCNKKQTVTNIFIQQQGLINPVKIDLSTRLFHEDWHTDNVFNNRLITLGDLFTYIHYSKKDDNTVTLPNNITCRIEELYDYICISFLATHKLLVDHNIFPKDMNSSNIFIHWLNDTSYYNSKNIKYIKKIVYKVGNKYYKIKTFGFIIILGDVGSFMMKIKPDVILIGYTPDIKSNYKKYMKTMNDTHNNTDLIYSTFHFLTPSQFQNTIAYKILNTEPYCNYPLNNWKLLGTDISFLRKKKSTVELLNFYHNTYGIEKYVEKLNNILITIN